MSIFGGSKKRRYHGDVDRRLLTEFSIDSQKSPGFPGQLAYLELLDTAYRARMNDVEAAFYVAVLYYCGLVREQHLASAGALYAQINERANVALRAGQLGRGHWMRFAEGIDQVHAAVGIASEFHGEAGPQVQICRPPRTFEELHHENAERYNDGDIELPEYLDGFRRLLLDEVRATLDGQSRPR